MADSVNRETLLPGERVTILVGGHGDRYTILGVYADAADAEWERARLKPLGLRRAGEDPEEYQLLDLPVLRRRS